MAMFDENFSFVTPRSPSLDSRTGATRDSSRSVSPCTTSAPFPLEQFSVTDLAAQFASQRLQRRSQICYDSCEAYANADDDADWSIPPIEDNNSSPLQRSQTFTQRPHSPSRRVQRQAQTRLLCTTSHHRDITRLVARMIESQEQCLVMPPEPATPPHLQDDEDEGYNSSDDQMTELSRSSSIVTTQSSHRRASYMIGSAACVNKKVRMRKEKRPARRRNTDRQ